MKTIKAIGVIGALGTLLVAVPALAQTQPSAAWVPGTDPMPRSMLMQFPCHSEEEPCSKIPAPEIQRVTVCVMHAQPFHRGHQAMLDRLDVVCLVSGDGDFEPLVQYAQSKGIRVEVVSVATSTAGVLKKVADQFIDLGARARDLRA
mgnify:CR=1 FL=1